MSFVILLWKLDQNNDKIWKILDKAIINEKAADHRNQLATPEDCDVCFVYLPFWISVMLWRNIF